MMEAAGTSETLVNFYQTTRCYNPEDSNLQRKCSLRLHIETGSGAHPASYLMSTGFKVAGVELVVRVMTLFSFVESTLKMDLVRSSKTLVTIYKAARRHNSEYHNRYLHLRKNLKSRIAATFLVYVCSFHRISLKPPVIRRVWFVFWRKLVQVSMVKPFIPIENLFCLSSFWNRIFR
jgi:hypothetical protein